MSQSKEEESDRIDPMPFEIIDERIQRSTNLKSMGNSKNINLVERFSMPNEEERKKTRNDRAIANRVKKEDEAKFDSKEIMKIVKELSKTLKEFMKDTQKEMENIKKMIELRSKLTKKENEELKLVKEDKNTKHS